MASAKHLTTRTPMPVTHIYLFDSLFSQFTINNFNKNIPSSTDLL